jgi:glyceraldehyde-3-phosphate dehydrogenase (NAD(P))
MIRVGINGYGVIGKRVADAVVLQPDMELVGVADVATDYRIAVARARSYPIFGATEHAVAALAAAGLDPAGALSELLEQVDVIVDATPKKVGATVSDRYRGAGIKVVYQGGEKHELTGVSFVAEANYAEALGRDAVRVVSCNTTGLVRVLHAMHERELLTRARCILLRRATDPWESHRGGMVNTLRPEPSVPSHQGPDAQTVMHNLDVVTVAAAGPFNLSHMHFAIVEAPRPTERAAVLEALEDAPRIVLVRAEDGIEAPNSVIEIARDIGRARNDVWEVPVWENSIATNGREIFLTYQVDNEAIVIPENIDAIRAVTASETDPAASIALTNDTLGLRRELLAPLARARAGMTL